MREVDCEALGNSRDLYDRLAPSLQGIADGHGHDNRLWETCSRSLELEDILQGEVITSGHLPRLWIYPDLYGRGRAHRRDPVDVGIRVAVGVDGRQNLGLEGSPVAVVPDVWRLHRGKRSP